MIFKKSTKTVIELDLDKISILLSEPGLMDQLKFPKPPTIMLDRLIEGILTAAEDKKVSGMVVNWSQANLAFGIVEEIRDAIQQFKGKGKFVYFYADTIGEFSPSNVLYYLASAADKVYMASTGLVHFTSFNSEVPFVRKMLDKIGVFPELIRFKDYKSFADTFTCDKLSEKNYEMVERVLSSVKDNFVRAIVDDRKVSYEDVISAIENAPLNPTDAVSRKLVDEILYRDQLYDRIKKDLTNPVEFRYITAYLKNPSVKKKMVFSQKSKFKIGVINLQGNIMRGSDSEKDKITDEAAKYAIRQAVDDENVKGIILRVNSGGGSAVASDQIAREIQRAKEKGKKVVASMVAVAASGGYFISMNADKVLVQKSTITGSIGVVFGKFVASELFERIGISWDDVKTGENGDLFSFNKKYSENTRKKAFNLGKEVYDDFVGKAAQARGMDVEKMEEVAQGRVWTGIDAKERNLVDEFGGLVRAIEFVKESSELKPAQKIELVRYPRPLSFFQSLFFQKKSSEDTNISQASVSMHPSPFAFALSMFGLSNSESRQISSTLESSLRHDQTLSLRLGLAESLALYSIIPCQH